MIYKNGKMTAWEDTPENLVLAAHEAAFSERHISVVAGNSGKIENILCDWVTEDETVKEAALNLGYWVEPAVGGGWSILFTWSKNPGKRPNNHAIHR